MQKSTFFFLRKIHFPDAKIRWAITVFVTLWVFLMLYSLQPFGINFAQNKLAIITINTVGVFFTCMVCIQGLPLIFRNNYISGWWTNGMFFISCLAVTMLFAILDTFVLSVFIDGLEGVPYYTFFPWYQRFFMFFKASFFTSLLPIFIVYYTLIKKSKVGKTTNHTKSDVSADCSLIELTGNTKDYIRLLPEDILYAKASGNYVAVYYLKNGDENRKLLRISMSELNDSLDDYPYIIRCHRAFMVNIQKMKRIQGNLNGYRIELEKTKIKIPVSKSYTRVIKEKVICADI